MSAKIITVSNNKGGVLKTSLIANISKFLSESKKVLIIDTDQQGNLSHSFYKNPENVKVSLASIFSSETKDVELENLFENIETNVDLIVGNFELAKIDFNSDTNIKKLQNFIKFIKSEKRYDYILIDTPPTMNKMILSLIKLSDLLIIPFTPEQFAYQGLLKLTDAKLQLPILLVPTKMNARSSLHNEMLNKIKVYIKDKKNIKLISGISHSIANETSIAFERKPISYLSKKHKNKNEYAEISSVIKSELKLK